jgi:CheY-like chemotaxis protein
MKPVIMLVDDDDLFLEELGQLLNSSGYETVEVHEARLVADSAKKIRPALILMDLKMPGQNGYEIAFELKEMPELAEIPIIAMSGLSDQKKSIYMELSRMREFLPKPFNPLELIWSIEGILYRGQTVFA